MADLIPQLFVQDYKNGQARALVAPLNALIFSNDTAESKWAKAYNESKPWDTYSPLVYFDTNQESNQLGQAYFQPVGVLNNANCYSACGNTWFI